MRPEWHFQGREMNAEDLKARGFNAKNLAQIYMRQAIADLRDDQMGLREQLSDICQEDLLDALADEVEQAIRSAQVIITWPGTYE